jgi:hypothetical protein
MKPTVFGAIGGVGRAVVGQALDGARGARVRAQPGQVSVDDPLTRCADALVRDAGAVAVEREDHYVVRFGGVPDGGVT